MESFNRYDRIEDYLKGKLSHLESRAFERELQNDVEFKAEVDLHRTALEVAEYDFLKDMKAKLDNADKSYNQKRTGKKKIILGTTLIAFLVGGTVLYSTTRNTISNRGEGDVKNNSEKERSTLTLHSYRKTEEVEIDTELEAKKYENSAVKKNTREEVIISKKPSLKEQTTVRIENSIPNNSEVYLESNTETQIKREVHPVFDEKKILETTTEEVTVIKDIDVCVEPKVEVVVQKASYEGNQGMIFIKNNSDSELHYKLEELEMGFSENPEFNDLAIGVYTLIIKEETCIFDMGKYAVENERCHEETDFAFNTVYEDYWEVPVKEKADVKIYDMNGNSVFEKEYNEVSELLWNGNDLTGNPVDVGVYRVIVTNSDYEKCKYNVVIEK